MSTTKFNEKSEILRAEGNKFYTQKMFYEALQKYNESLCFATPATKYVGLSYANRSAVYFELKLFEKCLANIELARKNHYPEENSEVLKKREEKCTQIVKMQRTQTNDFPILSHPSSKQLPFVAECLEVKFNEKFGRHIVTNRPLKVGDIVAVEEPFCRIIHESFIHQKCNGCFKDNLFDLVPCRTCSKAMFCSIECEKNSASFHKYECPVMELILSPTLTSTMKIALRIFFIALSTFEGSIIELETFFNSNTKPLTIFDVNSSTDVREMLVVLNSLIFNSEVEVHEKLFDEIFLTSTALKGIWSSHRTFIRTFLKRHTQIGTMNYHEIYNWPLKKVRLEETKNSLAYKSEVVAVGSGSYPFISLINHHCAPNVNRVFVHDKNVLVVQRPIKKGEQLFDNYGCNFVNMPKKFRISELLQRYRFKCSCEACENNWPLLPAIKIIDKACLNKAKKACRELSLSDGNNKKAAEKYKELCQNIEHYHKNFPSLEICSMLDSATAYLELSLKPFVQF